jgi:hypothetical protein
MTAIFDGPPPFGSEKRAFKDSYSEILSFNYDLFSYDSSLEFLLSFSLADSYILRDSPKVDCCSIS